MVVDKRAWALLGRAFFYQGESLARTIQPFRPRFSNDALINHSGATVPELKRHKGLRWNLEPWRLGYLTTKILMN
jgi:hypothetical protein